MSSQHDPSMMEPLETRRHLTAALSNDGALLITGTHKGDRIFLTVDAKTPDQVSVTINGAVRRFLLDDIDNINIQAGQGNDIVTIDPGQKPLSMPTRIYGSGGNDSLTSGYGVSNRIYGGTGNDTIKGGRRRDIAYGEEGKDTIDGGERGDAIDGGDGNDDLTGGEGVDRITGGAGNDTIHSKDGGVDGVDGGEGDDSADTDKLDEDLVSIEHVLNPREPS